MILYHGSNIEIGTIDLNKCRPCKDFGKGFYTSPTLEHAWTMAKRTVRINKEGSPCVTVFSFDDSFLTGGEPRPVPWPNSAAGSDTALNVRQFTSPDSEWARFVINNRNRKFHDIKSPDCNTDNKYDIVIGPVANDDIAALIDVFLAGLISDDALAKELIFRDLSAQVSFHTEKSISGLRKKEAYHG
jgi:hypothetical protein